MVRILNIAILFWTSRIFVLGKQPFPTSTCKPPIYWTTGLREASYRALTRKLGRENDQLRIELYNSPIIDVKVVTEPQFGDIVLLAKGQLYRTRKRHFKFVQDLTNSDCKRRGTCTSHKPNYYDRLLGIWTVERVRHYDLNRGYYYEFQYNIVLDSDVSTPLTRDDEFDYSIPGHLYIVKVCHPPTKTRPTWSTATGEIFRAPIDSKEFQSLWIHQDVTTIPYRRYSNKWNQNNRYLPHRYSEHSTFHSEWQHNTLPPHYTTERNFVTTTHRPGWIRSEKPGWIWSQDSRPRMPGVNRYPDKTVIAGVNEENIHGLKPPYYSSYHKYHTTPKIYRQTKSSNNFPRHTEQIEITSTESSSPNQVTSSVSNNFFSHNIYTTRSYNEEDFYLSMTTEKPLASTLPMNQMVHKKTGSIPSTLPSFIFPNDAESQELYTLTSNRRSTNPSEDNTLHSKMFEQLPFYLTNSKNNTLNHTSRAITTTSSTYFLQNYEDRLSHSSKKSNDRIELLGPVYDYDFTTPQLVNVDLSRPHQTEQNNYNNVFLTPSTYTTNQQVTTSVPNSYNSVPVPPVPTAFIEKVTLPTVNITPAKSRRITSTTSQPPERKSSSTPIPTIPPEVVATAIPKTHHPVPTRIYKSTIPTLIVEEYQTTTPAYSDFFKTESNTVTSTIRNRLDHNYYIYPTEATEVPTKFEVSTSKPSVAKPSQKLLPPIYDTYLRLPAAEDPSPPPTDSTTTVNSSSTSTETTSIIRRAKSRTIPRFSVSTPKSRTTTPTPETTIASNNTKNLSSRRNKTANKFSRTSSAYRKRLHTYFGTKRPYPRKSHKLHSTLVTKAPSQDTTTSDILRESATLMHTEDQTTRPPSQNYRSKRLHPTLETSLTDTVTTESSTTNNPITEQSISTTTDLIDYYNNMNTAASDVTTTTVYPIVTEATTEVFTSQSYSTSISINIGKNS